MNQHLTDYRLWTLVIINSAVVIIFAHSFTHPRTARDWRSFGAFVAFIVALFTEMYGLPLTIFLLSSAWKVLYLAQRSHTLAVTGPYSHIRHPQYVGFVLIMLGFLLQWPTLITMFMFPVLILMYVRLARHEEQGALVEFGKLYALYVARTPAVFPRLSNAGKLGG